MVLSWQTEPPAASKKGPFARYGTAGLFAIQSAKVLGAERIIAIETVPERITMARKAGAMDVINFAEEDIYERIKEMSKGEGADVVIDCVGMEQAPVTDGPASSAP